VAVDLYAGLGALTEGFLAEVTNAWVLTSSATSTARISIRATRVAGRADAATGRNSGMWRHRGESAVQFFSYCAMPWTASQETSSRSAR